MLTDRFSEYFFAYSKRYLLVALFIPASFAPALLAQNKVPVESLNADTPATQENSINQRLSKVENLLESKGLFSLLQQLETLQQEISELRGQIEVNVHVIETMQKRQRDLYIDMDRRIQRAEKKDPSNQSSIENQLSDTVTDQSTQENQEPAEETTQPIITDSNQATLATQNPDKLQLQAEYQRAFELLKRSKYTQAIKAFNTFLENYTENDYSDNAQYWVAEAYYAQSNYEKSIETYQKLIRNYPKSQKLSQSLLKIGYSYEELDQPNKAKLWYLDVRQRFPGSTVSRLAEERLKRI